eukprot:COSAG01_NODE_37_length_34085_cov_64.376626_38_plen_285_part_00
MVNSVISASVRVEFSVLPGPTTTEQNPSWQDMSTTITTIFQNPGVAIAGAHTVAVGGIDTVVVAPQPTLTPPPVPPPPPPPAPPCGPIGFETLSACCQPTNQTEASSWPLTYSDIFNPDSEATWSCLHGGPQKSICAFDEETGTSKWSSPQCYEQPTYEAFFQFVHELLELPNFCIIGSDAEVAYGAGVYWCSMAVNVLALSFLIFIIVMYCKIKRRLKSRKIGVGESSLGTTPASSAGHSNAYPTPQPQPVQVDATSNPVGGANRFQPPGPPPAIIEDFSDWN